jgi:hypothetical protein
MPNNPSITQKQLEALAQGQNPLMMEAAKDLLDLMDAASFSSPIFTTQMLAYYSIEPPGIEAAVENLGAFCMQTLESDDRYAKTVVKCFVDRITADGFEIDFNTLTTIGITLGDCKYEEQGVRCLKHAGTLFTQARKSN